MIEFKYWSLLDVMPSKWGTQMSGYNGWSTCLYSSKEGKIIDFEEDYQW